MGDDESEATRHYEVETTYVTSETDGTKVAVYEPGRNVSLIKNNKTSVIEPRIVAVPGTIKVDGVWTGAPEDLFFSFSTDKGTTMLEEEWVVNPDSSGNFPGVEVTGWYRLAKGVHEQGEVQLRMTPDGSRFYACWLDEGEEGSDIVLRRITDGEFPANVADATATATVSEDVEIVGDADDFGSDSGDGTDDGD